MIDAPIQQSAAAIAPNAMGDGKIRDKEPKGLTGSIVSTSTLTNTANSHLAEKHPQIG